MKDIFLIARQFLKRAFHKIRNQRFRNNLLQAIPFWAASLLTGLIAVLYTRLFASAEHLTSLLFHQRGYWLFLITPVCFVLSWWIVFKFSPAARGSGIPQVMASIELATPINASKVDRLLNLKVIFIKVISSLVMVLGGGVVGREGPTIQIAGSVFRKVHTWLPKWWPKTSKKNMIMTGAAAGLAAAFNTPLGGIVFAVEELTKTHINYFKTALFTAVIIAGLTAQAFLGPYLYLGYPDVTGLSRFIFFSVVVVAIICGFAGSAMSKIILVILRWKGKLQKGYHHLVFILLAGLIIVSIAYFLDPFVLGSGKSLMTQTLFTNAKYSSWHTAFSRVIGPIFCFTTGGAGGIFSPSLSAGAGIGSAISGWLHLSSPDTNVLILTGMAAFLTGVTRTPFTSAILVLEMTDRHNLIFHLMLATMIANLVSVLIDRHSLYDRLKINYLHELTHEENKTEAVIQQVPQADEGEED